MGTEASKLGEQLKQIAGESKKPTLVIVFQGCEGCGAQNLQEWAEVPGNWETWRKTVKSVLVIKDRPEKVREKAQKGKWKVPVIADADGEMAQKLNAFFSPRAYGFVDGRLVWVQKRVGMSVVETL